MINTRFRSDLTKALTKAREIVRYYRTGPLGDVAAANGKIVEEALRHVLESMGKAPVTTNGLVDLGVAKWGVGFQVKTFRTKCNNVIFARSNKVGKKARVADVRDRIATSLLKTETQHLVLLDYDMFSSDVNLYLLASVVNGKVKTFGSFLADDNVSVSKSDTHFRIKKNGLLKIA